MTKSTMIRPRVWWGVAALLGVFAVSLGLTFAQAQPPTTKPPVKKLNGAELYALNCNRCHAERYPPEFTSAQWQTIMLHMRVRANLPAAQSKLILQYLQESRGK